VYILPTKKTTSALIQTEGGHSFIFLTLQSASTPT